MSADEKFRNSLLAQDEFCKEDVAAYRRTIQKALDKKLSPLNRAAYGLICLASLLAFFYFVKLAFFQIISDEMIRLSVQLISFLAIILIGVLAVMTGWSAISGRSMGHFYPAFVFGSFFLILFYYFVTMLYFTYIAPVTLENPLHPSSMLAHQIMIILFFAMVLMGLLLIFRAMTKANFEQQRKLLEIEYKLCTVLEKLENPQNKQVSVPHDLGGK